MNLRRLRKNEGFTLIELLIVVAIIGILAAIAIPNLLNALQRGKQKRTMSDIRNLATAIESYNVDNNFYPSSACPTGVLTDETGNGLTSSSFSLLKPTYIALPPYNDGWAHPLHYSSAANATEYDLVSYGRDGGQDGAVACGTTTDFNSDIVYSNGTFVQYPDGPQH